MSKFRGSMSAPKHNHGETLMRCGKPIGVVQHRRYNGYNWEYGLLVAGSVMILWVSE